MCFFQQLCRMLVNFFLRMERFSMVLPPTGFFAIFLAIFFGDSITAVVLQQGPLKGLFWGSLDYHNVRLLG